MEAPTSVQRSLHRARHRGALAHLGELAQSPVFFVSSPQRTWSVPRLPVVFLYERTGTAFFESALSKGLQHGAPLLFLGTASRVAFSMERLPPGHCQTIVQTRRSCR